MRVPVSWLREYVALGDVDLSVDGPGASGGPLTVADLDAALVRSGLEVEAVHRVGEGLRGPIVIGEVTEIVELPGFKKPIRHCQVDVGEAQPRSIVCGARNFTVGDRVVVSLPGAVLPGGFEIASRTTYGQLSDGMICATDELGMGPRTDGILLLTRDEFTGSRLGDDAIAVLGLTDVVFELAITPDRGYCFSIRGVARELSHVLGVQFTDPARVTVPAATPQSPYPVRIEDSVDQDSPDKGGPGCDRFAGRVVRGLDPTRPTPWWMRRRLLLAGVRSISLAVDVTNYLMFALGQPMHAYDLAALRGQMVVRRAAAGEKLHTLDGVQRVLDPQDLVIADDTGPIGLAAVMGGATTEVTAATTQLLIESAHWDPVTAARTARRHQLPSEASKRFERGVDTELGPVAAQLAVRLLTELAGGTADPLVLDLDTHRSAAAIPLDPGLADRVVGVGYGPRVVAQVLERIGCRVGRGDSATWSVTPPSWRGDLTDPIDLVEEVVRLQGYDAVPSVLPPAPASPGLSASLRGLRSVS
ncbi:MAG: phenylalanine--tRNA ligase subunit beta, partial [Mycobacteriales bacterium]